MRRFVVWVYLRKTQSPKPKGRLQDMLSIQLQQLTLSSYLLIFFQYLDVNRLSQSHKKSHFLVLLLIFPFLPEYLAHILKKTFHCSIFKDGMVQIHISFFPCTLIATIIEKKSAIDFNEILLDFFFFFLVLGGRQTSDWNPGSLYELDCPLQIVQEPRQFFFQWSWLVPYVVSKVLRLGHCCKIWAVVSVLLDNYALLVS